MKKCTISDLMFYSMDGLNSTYVIMRLELDQMIRKDLMKESFSKACRRFPYFQTRLQKLDSGFALQANENKPVMHEDPLDYVINASENDGFLYRFSVLENTVTFSMFHGLSDSFTVIAFLKVILNEYFEELGEHVVPSEDIYDINGNPDFEETQQPLDFVPSDVKPAVSYGSKCFHIPGKAKNTRKCDTAYTFSADGEKIMQYASSYNGTPNTIAAVTIAKAIQDIHSKALKDGIDIAITINAKPIIGKAKSHWPFLQTSTFHFDEQKMNMDEKLLHTSLREKLSKDCTKEKLFPALAGVRGVGAIFEYIKDERARKLLCLKSTDKQRATVTVSYARTLDFGSIGKHIKGLYSFCDSAAPTLEINYNNGVFYFALSSQTDSRIYAEKIIEHFNKMDFKCSKLKCINFQLAQGKKDKPKFGLNLSTLHLISGISAYKKSLKKYLKPFL